MIVKSTDICGGKARIAGTRIPVWGLEQMRRSGLTETQIMERYPTLTPFELGCAWTYVENCKAEIEKQIEANK